jgi:hypothetical protein
VEEHLPSFTPDIEQALADAGRKDLIRERARKLGITLKGVVDEEIYPKGSRSYE